MTVTATAVWRIRPSGSDTNGGGYDTGIAGHATDYSQQDAAQATGTLGTAAGTTAFSDAGGAFTALMIGNALWIASGTGFTVGAYFITAFTSSTAVTLDRSPGTGSAAVWALGGGWATFTNLASSQATVNGNIAYVLGSGTPNPSAYTYDYTISATTIVFANITIANDPSTSGYTAPPNTTGGMPVIKHNLADSVLKTSGAVVRVQGLWGVGTTTAAAKGFLTLGASDADVASFSVFGCVYDQFSFNTALYTNNGNVPPYALIFVGCEVFSSAGGTGGTLGGVNNTSTGSNAAMDVIGCNIHDCVGFGIQSRQPANIVDTIVAKCNKDGIEIALSGVIKNCTIDGNLGDGIFMSLFSTNFDSVQGAIMNNIISNQTQAGKFGLQRNNTYETGDVLFIDYNVYYNNTSNYSGIVAGAHDTALGQTPMPGSQRKIMPLRNIPSDAEILAAVNERARLMVNADTPGERPYPSGFRCDLARSGFIRRRWEKAVGEYKMETGLDPIEALARLEAEKRRG